MRRPLSSATVARTLGALAFALLAREARAQAAPTPAATLRPHMGEWLRLETSTRRHGVRGSLVAIDGDTLVVQTVDASIPGDPPDVIDQVHVPVTALRRAFVRDGRETRLHAATRDGIYGTVLGATVVAATYVTAKLVEKHRAQSDLLDDLGYGLGHPGHDPTYVRESTQQGVRYASVLVPGGVMLGVLRPRWRWREIPLAPATR